MTTEVLLSYLPLVVSGLLIIITLLLAKIKTMANKIKSLEKQAQEVIPEGYDKFVVESRQWAFDYIEQVQTNLQELVDAAEQIDKTVKKLLPNK